MRSNFAKLIALTRVNNYECKFIGTRPQFVAMYNRSYSNTSSSQEVVKQAEGAPVPVEPLVDSFGRRHDYLRISLTERCNLRCQYCMPLGGAALSPRASLLSAAEVGRVAGVLARGGVRKARLTGGEPTLRADLPQLVAALSGAGLRVALTSNGLVLARRLPALQRAGLAALNLSLDSLRADRFERMARRPGLPRVLAALDLALQLGYRPVKLNVVLIRGFNDDEMVSFVELTRCRPVEVRFIEFMPFTGNQWDDARLVPYREALAALRQHYPDMHLAPPRPNDTATMWQMPGHEGAVGFIHSMSAPFCATCNRLRLTADGSLKVCLFGNKEVSLRDAMRAGASDQELDALVRAALRGKKKQHAARRLLAGAGAAPRRLAVRHYSTRADDEGADGAFSHLDAAGRARMVDVGGKAVTARAAGAGCSLHVSARLLRLLRDARLPKGDALTVAQVAGALGAKRTAALLPLCHSLPLDSVRLHVELPRGECPTGGALLLRCEVSAHARTGVEMEALTGAAVAALALYDMCKSVDRDMRITDLRVLHKSGGRSDRAPDARPPSPPPAAAHHAPKHDHQTYVPTDLAHF